MNCNNCKKEINSEDKFCGNCGKEINDGGIISTFNEGIDITRKTWFLLGFLKGINTKKKSKWFKNFEKEMETKIPSIWEEYQSTIKYLKEFSKNSKKDG